MSNHIRFTEDEINETIDNVVRSRLRFNGKVGCPFNTYRDDCTFGASKCGRIFGTLLKNCPCFVYNKEEVIDKFWSVIN